MKVYTKINSLYKRYQKFAKDCPNPKWLVMQNKIILGEYADPTFKYLNGCLFEGYSKIDGTNSKICFFPSTGKIKIGGKTDKASSQSGQFEMLQEIADKIQPTLCEMFPKDMARFAPVMSTLYNKPSYFDADGNEVQVKCEGTYQVKLEELPIYIYGEYFGKGIQKCGGRYSDGNDFIVFDIDVQGWWVPKSMRDDYCEQLGLKTVPFIGIKTINEFEQIVAEGFTTKVENVKDNTLIEEGIVARPCEPIKDSRGNRIIVKIKHVDYVEYENARKTLNDEEFKEFTEWYNTCVEPI